MNFFQKIYKSIYAPSFYQELLGRPFSFSLKYFYLLTLILVLFVTVVFSLSLIPNINAFLKEFGPKILEAYPQELVITIKNGKASINVPEPYTIKFPDILGGNEDKISKNLLIINTKTPFSLQEFRSYDTTALLTENELVFHGDKGDIRIQPLDQVPDTEITKSFIESLIKAVEPFMKYAAPLFAVMMFVGFFIFYHVNLLYLLFAALLIWIMAKIKKFPIGYKKSYQISIHAMTLPLILYTLAFAFVPQALYTYVFTVLLLIVAWVNVRVKGEISLRDTQTPLPPQSPLEP